MAARSGRSSPPTAARASWSVSRPASIRSNPHPSTSASNDPRRCRGRPLDVSATLAIMAGREATDSAEGGKMTDTTAAALDVLLQEDRRYPPSEEFRAQAG